MAIFRNLSPDLRKAVETIRDECAKHNETCKECPFWLNDGMVCQRCGLTVYEGRMCYYPSEWEVEEDGKAEDHV